jgi:hypothetical protein
MRLPALDRWWRLAAVAFACSATIEPIQLFVPDRSADVDDVIVNVIGALVGFEVYRLVLRGGAGCGSAARAGSRPWRGPASGAEQVGELGEARDPGDVAVR